MKGEGGARLTGIAGRGLPASRQLRGLWRCAAAVPGNGAEWCGCTVILSGGMGIPGAVSKDVWGLRSRPALEDPARGGRSNFDAGGVGADVGGVAAPRLCSIDAWFWPGGFWGWRRSRRMARRVGLVGVLGWGASGPESDRRMASGLMWPAIVSARRAFALGWPFRFATRLAKAMTSGNQGAAPTNASAHCMGLRICERSLSVLGINVGGQKVTPVEAILVILATHSRRPSVHLIRRPIGSRTVYFL
jgi:hypothetical protein